MNVGSGQRWAVILAGGEGLRLRPLTSRIAGDDRAKQFCAVLGRETLFERTRRRAALVAEDERTLLVLTRAHAPFYAPLVANAPAGTLVVQPQGRGTAPAVVYALLRITAAAQMATVALLPSDHYVSDDARFMAHVEAAFAAAEARPDLLILLGIRPADAEPEYGWIEAGERIFGDLRRVRRFWEKPGRRLAETLLRRGCLWNTFVMVGSVAVLTSLIHAALPNLLRAFAPLGAAMGTAGEAAAAEAVYARLSPENFSDAVLAGRPANLAVLPVRGVEWSDWGLPERVLATLARLEIEPEWAERRLADSA